MPLIGVRPDGASDQSQRPVLWIGRVGAAAVWLACHSVRHHAPAMFIVSEEAATAIRTAYEQEGEMSAAIEVRRLFPGITDNAAARECARTIASWTPLPLETLLEDAARARRLAIDLDGDPAALELERYAQEVEAEIHRRAVGDGGQ